jgi:hypothetical protein
MPSEPLHPARSSTLVVSHTDADGVFSSRIMESSLSSLYKVDVKFQDWNVFGIREEDIPLLKEYGNVFVLDLGTASDTLENLAKVASEDTHVYLIDHHPPDTSVENFQSPTFKILNDPTNCTSGLCYRFLSELSLPTTQWTLVYATLGTYSDVATELEGGKEIIEETKEAYPLLSSSTVYWNGSYEVKIPIASEVGAYINAARRVAYNNGPVVSRRALIEMENHGSLDFLMLPFGDSSSDSEDNLESIEPDFPYASLLRTWRKRWLEKRNECLKEDICHTFDVDGVQICFTNHRYDCSSYVAGVKSRTTPCIAINYGVPDEESATLSGRSPPDKTPGYTNLNELMIAVGVVSKGMISGGGHPVAVGGKVSRILRPKQVIEMFHSAIRVVR